MELYFRPIHVGIKERSGKVVRFPPSLNHRKKRKTDSLPLPSVCKNKTARADDSHNCLVRLQPDISWYQPCRHVFPRVTRLRRMPPHAASLHFVVRAHARAHSHPLTHVEWSFLARASATVNSSLTTRGLVGAFPCAHWRRFAIVHVRKDRMKVQDEQRQERSVVDRSGDDQFLVTRCVIETAKFARSAIMRSRHNAMVSRYHLMDYLMFSFFVSRADERGIPEALKSHMPLPLISLWSPRTLELI